MVERRKLTKREYNRVVKEMQLDGAKAWAVAERVGIPEHVVAKICSHATIAGTAVLTKSKTGEPSERMKADARAVDAMLAR
jgi:hypothetical protein